MGKKIVIFGPSATGKSHFISRHGHDYNNHTLWCNEWEGSSRNVIGGINMGATSAMVPKSHPLYRSWEDIYMIGLEWFLDNEIEKDSALIYNCPQHISHIQEINKYTLYGEETDIRVVIPTKEEHRKMFENRVRVYGDTKMSEIMLSEEGVGFSNYHSWWYIMEERRQYIRICSELNVKVFNTYEEALSV